MDLGLSGKEEGSPERRSALGQSLGEKRELETETQSWKVHFDLVPRAVERDSQSLSAGVRG